MKTILFPDDVSRQCAKDTAEAYKAHKPGNHTSHNFPCYRKPDGTLRPVYDPYKAAYPEGCTPGLGTVEAVVEYYPNDTTGYSYVVTAFESLPNLAIA